MMISDLPDYPTIKQIRDALWNIGDVRGAAVMVGSGFSRHAILNDPSIPAPPLWTDFSRKMEQRLYPKGGAPSNPLRLAQEYRAELGDPALDGLITSLILDGKWEPSAVHTSLLSLPWSDVLTTNWDTLLERTLLSETERTYDIVRTKEDISRTRAPRIVKLHGSLPANRPFIFTEEDFRTYPRTFAPFVNLAQQVLLENELCLVGFSGEDPNFLQWAGWVRDNLGSASRHIRLVGVLDLSRSRKEMLKQQNVTAIDLSPLVENLQDDVKHSKAILIFLEWLAKSKPVENHVWHRPSTEAFSSNSTLRSEKPSLNELTEAWQIDRKKFPGWVVTPETIQRSLRYETDKHYPSKVALSGDIDPGTKMRFLFELTYRHKIAFWPLAQEYAKIIRDSYSNGGEDHLLEGEKTQLCAFMMAEARRKWHWKSFDFWASHMEKSQDPTSSVELHYEIALRAKQELDLYTLEKAVVKIVGDDTIWKLRQGMLYAFLYKCELAAQCFRSALLEIRDRRSKDKQSVWLLSREAWAAWIFRTVQLDRSIHEDEYLVNFSDWPTHYSQRDCDPWQYTGMVQKMISDEYVKSLDKDMIRAPLFDAGHYRDHSESYTYTSHTEVSSFHLLTRLQETVGIPAYFGTCDLLSTNFERAFTPLKRSRELDYFNAVSLVKDYDKGLIDIAFNRIEVAKIPINVATKLAAALREATNYLLSETPPSENRNYAVSRVRINIEIISRLCVRESPDSVQSYFLWAVELCENKAANDWWLYKHIGNVLKRCIEALPKSYRKIIAENAIFLPLPCERNTNGMEKDWPEVIDEFEPDDLVRPEGNLKWASRIEELIQKVEGGSELDRDRAILRLYALVKSDQLLPDESDQLAEAIWSKTNETEKWPSTGCIYPHVFLELPIPNSNQAIDIFISKVVDKITKGIVEEDLINTLSGALKQSRSALGPTDRNFSINILEACLSWQPKDVTSDIFGQSKYQNRKDGEAIALFLSDTLLPELTTQDITKEVKNLWHDILLNRDCTYMVGTAFEYARLFPQENDVIVHIIRKALYSGNKTRISFGYFATQQYIKAHRQDSCEVPKILISTVISKCENLQVLSLHESLYTAVKLVEANVVQNEDLLRLSELVEIIWSEFTYDSESLSNEHLITWTLIRSQCVKLANALMRGGQNTNSNAYICQMAAEDAIPEVRFALEGSH